MYKESNFTATERVTLYQYCLAFTFGVLLHLLDPLFQVLEALSLVDVVDEYGAVGRAEEVLAEVDVLLLPRRVPEVSQSVSQSVR